MTIAKYRPQAVLTSPFSELVNEFFGRDIGQTLGQDDARRNVPAVNIVERDNEFELHLMAPGYAKEDLKLNVEDSTLTVSAEKKSEDLKENERFTRREFMHSSFARSFRLPETVNAEGIRAEHVNGMLVVRIPKAEAVRPKAREITIG
ncbi:MAG: Hsp20/alpha crystallin family protein [Flavobacteriales bacterium]|nr:Hsp20/alpha crystallin family protein [Flavobacteriales bacterium]